MSQRVFVLIAVALMLCTTPSAPFSMNVTGKKCDLEDEKKLVDYIEIYAYSEPILLQVIDHLWFFIPYRTLGTVDFGDVCLYFEKPATVHVDYAIIWQDGTEIINRSFHKRITSVPCGQFLDTAALAGDVYKKVKSPVGIYVIQIEIHVEDDNSSKVVKIPGVMFYYVCILSTGPFLFTYIRDILWMMAYMCWEWLQNPSSST